MPRYHFDVINGHGLERDEEGQEMQRHSVPEQVAIILTDIARDELPNSPKAAIRVEVRDSANHAIFSGELSFKSQWAE